MSTEDNREKVKAALDEAGLGIIHFTSAELELFWKLTTHEAKQLFIAFVAHNRGLK